MIFNKVKEAEAKHYMPVFSRDNLCIDHGEGNCLSDGTGNGYVDFVAGIATNVLGYNHPELTEAICAQVKKLMHVSNHYYTQIQSDYITHLAEASGYDRIFLCNSGAEANECAIKLARKNFIVSGNGKKTILVSEGAFHGRTIATLTATGNAAQRATYAPLPDGFKYFAFNDFDDFRSKLTPDVGAVLIETIQGESGSVPFPTTFW